MTAPQNTGNDRDAGVVEEICGYLTSTPPKSFFLFAGAGSGKTRTLVEVLRRLTGVEKHDAGSRLANRLRARGQSIRVITYTRNAVAVINGRLGHNTLARVSTIHRFCWDLIAGFDNDIREALLDLNAKELQIARDDAAVRRRGPTEKNAQTIKDLDDKASSLESTQRFLYNPDRNTYGEGALQHDQVLKVAAWLLRSRPTLRTVLVDQHPVILIDESQDTMIGMLEALMQVADEEPSRLTLGLLGDHRQRIYMDGHRDLPSLIPKNWALPKLEMNHRSQHRIVELINRIWKADLEGRTQPTAGIQQYSRTEKSGGTVQIFIGDANLGPEDKIRREALCAKKMANIAGHPEWDNPTGGYQVLALEHKLAARRGNFSDVFNAMHLIDPDSAKPQGNGDNNGPSSVQVLMHEIPALAACIDGQGLINEFAVIEVLNRYDRLQGLPSNVTGQQARLTELNMAERLVRALQDPGPPLPVPERGSDEPTEDRQCRGWHGLFNSHWAEVSRYQTYLEGRSNLSTHQVVKGSEFEHVMVVMDDQEAGGNLFSYDKLFGAVPLSPRDQANATENKETTIDRTLRLLYVTCSRARESLALVLWSLDPETAIRSIKAGGWFTETEIQRVPQI